MCSLSIMQYDGFTTGCFQGILNNRNSFTGDAGNAFCSFRTKVWLSCRVAVYRCTPSHPPCATPPSPQHACTSFALLMLWRSEFGQMAGPTPYTCESLLPIPGGRMTCTKREEPSPPPTVLCDTDSKPHRDIQTPPGEWVTIACPFDHFYLTQRGALAAGQRPINQARITGMGVTATGEGQFKFEVQYIDALYEWQAGEYAALPYAAAQAQLRAGEAARAAAPQRLQLSEVPASQHPLSKSVDVTPLASFLHRVEEGAPASEEERVRRVRKFVESPAQRARQKTDTAYFRGEKPER